MQDFIRIRGEIVSSPLNENFRRLLNQISISNTNLVFPEENAVVDTINDMLAIEKPAEAQTCYVVSSGELYRYSIGDDKWYKIADFGQTFRQGFLNSGAVVLEDYIKLKEGSKTILQTPNMLVYFKNKPGDDAYLKGMYRIEAQEVDITKFVSAAGAYSLFIDEKEDYSVSPGLPSTDNPSYIFIGTFITNSNQEVLEDFIYTLPDIAYTADRGHFFIDGGRATGLALAGAEGKKVSRKEGFYYDEGINFSIGQTENFPVDTDNGSNFDLKTFEAENPVSNLWYAYPEDMIVRGFEKITTQELVINKYYDRTAKELRDVEVGSFTIQHHLVTPNGQNIMVYGDRVYNSYDDAKSNLNTPVAIDADFPYAEVTRVLVGNVENFNSNSTEDCDFYVMERLAQVGTISPVFADNIFTLYSGEAGDDLPAKVQFSLNQLQKNDFNDLYTLNIKSNKENDYKFALTNKYLYGHGNEISADDTNISPNIVERDVAENGAPGYTIPTEYYVNRLRQRIEDIEKQIWSSPDASKTLEQLEKDIHNQSIRFRLYDIERRVDLAENDIKEAEEDIKELRATKVEKDTMINGYYLGDDNTDEVHTITLVTGDIQEGVGKDNKPINLWYTEDRVSANKDVVNATTHINTLGSGKLTDNAHALSTDDITVGTRKFVTQNDLSKLANVPANTNNELAKKLENITIQSITDGAATTLGKVTTIAVDTWGANVTVDSTNKIATIECVGQLDPDDFLKKEDYAITSIGNPEYAGYVDRAISADNLTAVTDGDPSQYYGTNEDGEAGVFDLPVWVSTDDAENYADVEQITFEPIDHSITLDHLANSRVVYTANNEESKLGTNVYDLVKYHYHKVYNNGSQGPYENGSTTQDTSAIYYSYKVPAGGLKSATYYFSYNNTSYKFTGLATMVVNTVLKFVPSTGILTYTLPGGSATTITATQVEPTAVNEAYWLSFVAQTDWNKVNEWNFGEGFSVEVIDGRAKINATQPGTGVTHFANLNDVAVTYEEKNVGKILELGKDNSGNYRIVLNDAPPLHQYMKMADYAYDQEKVNVAVNAENAAVATTANKLQNKYTVNDAGTSSSTLWSASQIKTNTSTQIKNEGVNTYSGTAVPTNDLGKDGDLYILLED